MSSLHRESTDSLIYSDTVYDDVLCSVFSGGRSSIPHSVC